MVEDLIREIEAPPNIAPNNQDQDLDSSGITKAHIERAADDQHNLVEEKRKGQEQDRLQRKEYAAKIFLLVCAWLVVLASGLATVGLKWLYLSDSVLIALITGTSVNIIGLMVIVARYLFPTKSQ